VPLSSMPSYLTGRTIAKGCIPWALRMQGMKLKKMRHCKKRNVFKFRFGELNFMVFS